MAHPFLGDIGDNNPRVVSFVSTLGGCLLSLALATQKLTRVEMAC
jgi:hypothetical protein